MVKIQSGNTKNGLEVPYNRQTPLKWIVKNFLESERVDISSQTWLAKLNKYLISDEHIENCNAEVLRGVFWSLYKIWHQVKTGALFVNRDFYLQPEINLCDPKIRRKLTEEPVVPKYDPIIDNDSFEKLKKSIIKVPHLHTKESIEETDLEKNKYSDIRYDSTLLICEHVSDITYYYNKWNDGHKNYNSGQQLNDKNEKMGPGPLIEIQNYHIVKTIQMSAFHNIVRQAEDRFLFLINNMDLRRIRRCPSCYRFFITGYSKQVTCGKHYGCSSRFYEKRKDRIKNNTNSIRHKIIEEGRELSQSLQKVIEKYKK